MASLEVEGGSGIVEGAEDGGRSNKKVDSNEIRYRGHAKKKKKKLKMAKSKKQSSFCMPKSGCFSRKSEPDGTGNFDAEDDDRCRTKTPTHLVVTVNGLIGRSVSRFHIYCILCLRSKRLSKN